MSDDETIAIAEVSEGDGRGRTVELPVLEVLTGRAFLTGKSGSGKSNTASVVAENLLDSGFGLLIVDIEGEYYGLKEEYEVLHAGADEECDIRVSEEHAGKIASLALEENVPIILDLSGFLDEGDARDLLTAVARRLFAKEKKLKQPFLMVVEEIHEYVPEGGGMDECGRMLVKVAKRGRKHGLGVLGISQRPADVKKDFITQCDWLVWHRLTWQNDTRVVSRVLGSDYADAVEDLDDGEAFLMTDWADDVRRVQFHRKRTFDAGATPGLDDFERPDLKSVSDDLVSELQAISEEQSRREDRINDLEAKLEEREQYIEELEAELADARDLSRMAEQFARAMTEQVQAGRPAARSPGDGDPPDRSGEASDSPAVDRGLDDDWSAGGDEDDPADDGGIEDVVSPEQAAIIRDAAAAHRAAGEGPGVVPPSGDGRPAEDSVDHGKPAGDSTGDGGSTVDERDGERPAGDPGDAGRPAEPPSGDAGGDPETATQAAPGDERPSTDAEHGFLSGDSLDSGDQDATTDVSPPTSGDLDPVPDDAGPPTDGPDTETDDRRPASDGPDGTAGGTASPSGDPEEEADGSSPALDALDALAGVSSSGTGGGGTSSDDVPPAAGDAGAHDDRAPRDGLETAGEGAPNDGPRPHADGTPADDPERAADDVRATVAALDETARAMLATYRDRGTARPEEVHETAGGSGDRAAAYRHNRALRTEGFVVHVGRGRYAYALPSVLDARCDGLDEERREALLERVEASF